MARKKMCQNKVVNHKQRQIAAYLKSSLWNSISAATQVELKCVRFLIHAFKSWDSVHIWQTELWPFSQSILIISAKMITGSFTPAIEISKGNGIGLAFSNPLVHFSWYLNIMIQEYILLERIFIFINPAYSSEKRQK